MPLKEKIEELARESWKKGLQKAAKERAKGFEERIRDAKEEKKPQAAARKGSSCSEGRKRLKPGKRQEA